MTPACKGFSANGGQIRTIGTVKGDLGLEEIRENAGKSPGQWR
jgi:hypothetical protein